MAEAAQAIEAAAEPEPAAEQLGSPPTSASPSHPTPSGGRKVLAAEIAEPFRAEIRETIAQRYGDAPPKLVGLLGNDDFAARKYAQWTGKACAADGIDFELREVPRHELEQALEAANADPLVSGIMVYYPVFGNEPSFYGGSMDDYLRDTIAVEKDVEGLCYTYRNKLYRNQRYLDQARQRNKCILPCTPLSCVKILEHLGAYDASLPVGNRLDGRVITVINRSEIVGRPLAAMLANDGATVYSVDIDSIYLMKRGQLLETEETPESCVRMSQVVITGVPTKDYRLPTEWIQPDTTVINVASYKNVDEASLLAVPGVRYVPLVGKVTVAMLLRNILRLHEDYHAKNRLAAPEAVASAQAAEEEGAEAQQQQGQGVKVPAPSPAASPLKPPAQAAA